jgi:1,2-phenylacetyl-CoA epoxidase PaaB subunit
MITERPHRSSQTVIFEVKLKLVLARSQLRSLPTHALEIDQIPGETYCATQSKRHPLVQTMPDGVSLLRTKAVKWY